MLEMIQRDERGTTRTEWLESHHTFSFGDYYNPRYMGFSVLLVINDDQVKPGKGFDAHSHEDMEIVTYVLEGTLAHQDSVGHATLIQAGEVQRMTAGSGIQHSEYNPSATDPVHFLQIWIAPDSKGLEPGYEQTRFDYDDKQGRWKLIVSPNGREGSLPIHQDVEIYLSMLDSGDEICYELPQQRVAWLHVAIGEVEINHKVLYAGDGIGFEPGETIQVHGLENNSEVLLFNLQHHPTPSRDLSKD